MITVITASLPTRGAMLAEAIASVNSQTLRPERHLVGIDYQRAGSAATRNALLDGVDTEFVAVLDDDDLFYPQHLATLLARGNEADVIYSIPYVDGRPGWQPVGPFDPIRLRRESYIPATALIRTALLGGLGGWRDSSACVNGWEDWDLWLRCLDAGARFAYVPEVTWLYQFHDGNKTHLGEANAR